MALSSMAEVLQAIRLLRPHKSGTVAISELGSGDDHLLLIALQRCTLSLDELFERPKDGCTLWTVEAEDELIVMHSADEQLILPPGQSFRHQGGVIRLETRAFWLGLCRIHPATHRLLASSHRRQGHRGRRG